MSKLKLPILLVMLSLSVVICHAKCICSLQSEHVPIIVKAGTQHSGNDRSVSMSANLNGHNLTVSFSQNIGEVSVEITSLSVTTLYDVSVQTPTAQQFYIPNAGSYVVTFTLQNGDEYYGEFEVLK